MSKGVKGEGGRVKWSLLEHGGGLSLCGEIIPVCRMEGCVRTGAFQKGLAIKSSQSYPRHKMCVCLKIVYKLNKEMVRNPSEGIRTATRDGAFNLWMRQV